MPTVLDYMPHGRWPSLLLIQEVVRTLFQTTAIQTLLLTIWAHLCFNLRFFISLVLVRMEVYSVKTAHIDLLQLTYFVLLLGLGVWRPINTCL